MNYEYLFPPPQDVMYSSQSHPERVGSSVQFSETNPVFRVPQDLIPPSRSLANGYSIVIYFKQETVDNDG